MILIADKNFAIKSIIETATTDQRITSARHFSLLFKDRKSNAAISRENKGIAKMQLKTISFAFSYQCH
jgi:hypothetical protein